jgi:hypothetical protein
MKDIRTSASCRFQPRAKALGMAAVITAGAPGWDEGESA